MIKGRKFLATKNMECISSKITLLYNQQEKIIRHLTKADDMLTTSILSAVFTIPVSIASYFIQKKYLNLNGFVIYILIIPIFGIIWLLSAKVLLPFILKIVNGKTSIGSDKMTPVIDNFNNVIVAKTFLIIEMTESYKKNKYQQQSDLEILYLDEIFRNWGSIIEFMSHNFSTENYQKYIRTNSNKKNGIENIDLYINQYTVSHIIKSLIKIKFFFQNVFETNSYIRLLFNNDFELLTLDLEKIEKVNKQNL
jgi:hypothetical protein